MTIYTRSGDKGKTGLYASDKRISKNSPIIHALGSIDEANTFLGLAVAFIKDKELASKITKIQRRLFEVGAILAGAKIRIGENLAGQMEKEIDGMDKKLPKLTHFVLPGGGKGGSLLFMARTFIRRAERKVVALSKKEKVAPVVLIYLNRLSDYVFTLARYFNFKEGRKEEIWKSMGK
jgi:cob(I)alamin adenosyltransferase